MAFQGSLSELHLPDIIQLVSVSGKTGVFRLIDGSHRGDIWLNEGRIVHAEHEDLAGEEAVYALAIWRTGEFRFEAGIAPPLASSCFLRAPFLPARRASGARDRAPAGCCAA